jgi:hypothetical protein
MVNVEISEDLSRRIENFTAVIRAVLDEDVDTDTCFGMALNRGLEAMLADLIARQDPAMLVESLQQLASRHPEVVYPYVADMVGLGADLRSRRLSDSRIGFTKTDAPAG